MLKMPIPSRWRSISVVLPLLFSAGPLLAPAPLLARSPETAAVLETMESGSVSRSAVEALLARANAGDTEAAEVAGRLYDRGVGVKWDPRAPFTGTPRQLSPAATPPSGRRS